jgi:CheY-like chemotaxis protein
MQASHRVGWRDMSVSILLVDDSDINLKVASLMLKKLGHQADIALNGIGAIEVLQHHSNITC